MSARTRTITCKNCGVSIKLTGRTSAKRTGPKDPNNVKRGQLLAKFSKANRLRTGSAGPFTRQQKTALSRIPKAGAKRAAPRKPKRGAQPPTKRQAVQIERFGPRFAIE